MAGAVAETGAAEETAESLTFRARAYSVLIESERGSGLLF
jgi:hypothetical protein